MADPHPSRTTPEDVRCAGCGYDLVGLKQSGECPECGFEIAASVAHQAELRAPLEKIPHLKATLALLVIATLTGAPALILFAGWEHIVQYASPPAGSNVSSAALSVTPWLLVIGSFMPILTILSVPPGTGDAVFRKQRTPIVLVLLILGSIGAVLYAYGPVLRWLELLHPSQSQIWVRDFVAPPIAACACAIGLSMAAKLIGQTVPMWKQLGAARQTAAPLVGAIILIGVLRPIVFESTLEGRILLGAKMVLVGAELLLAIGALYLLLNRIWLASRLAQALRLIRQQMKAT